MPDELPAWNEDNLSKIITDLYEEAVRDAALYEQLMTDPYTTLSTRIAVPPGYQKNFLAKPSCNQGMILNVPPFQGDAPVVPQAPNTVPATQANYVIVCTVIPW